MNTKMKVLSLALVGAFGYVGAASAACPTDPAQAGGGAWSAKFVSGGSSALSIVTPGYDSSECKLQVSLGNNGLARAQVQDTSPANETRYRAQFIFDAGSLNGSNGLNQAPVFLVNSAAPNAGTLNIAKVTFAGTGGGSTTAGKRVFIAAADEGVPGGFTTAALDLPNQTGANRIEIDLQIGAAGTGKLIYWVNDAATTGLTEANSTGTITLTGANGNSNWTGVDAAFLGLTSPTLNYRNLNADAKAWFDQFDSRRTTFIGHN